MGHSHVPVLRGLSYHVARELLLNAGWQPIIRSGAQPDIESFGAFNGNADEFINRGYHELDSASTTGLSFCLFKLRDLYRNVLHVVSAGEEDSQAGQEAHVQSWWIETAAEVEAELRRSAEKSTDTVNMSDRTNAVSPQLDGAEVLQPRNGSGLFSLLRRAIQGPRSVSSTAESPLPQRFIDIFEQHGLHRNQVPRFFEHDLAPKDVIDNASVLKALTEPMLASACVQFAVRREWLDGADDQVHPCHDFYQYPTKFAEFVTTLSRSNERGQLKALVIAPNEKNQNGEAVMILAEPVGQVGDKAIFRYHLCNNWLFGYWKAHAYLTACIAIAWKHEIYVQGRYAASEVIENVRHGGVPLGPIFDHYFLSYSARWNADDWVYEPAEYLKGIDRETNDYGHRKALQLWLELDDSGLMDTGHNFGSRSKFERVFSAYA